MIRLLLVDDHDLIRGGLRRAFETAADVAVVGETGTVAEALALVAATTPDVVVVDVNLPDGDGIALTRRLREQYPTMGVVVLTMHDSDDFLFKALEAGASAFVTKGSPTPALVSAVLHAAASPTAFSAADLALAMQRRMRGGEVRLTEREVEILELLKLGLPVNAIAAKLYISPSTAKTHVSRLYDKLGASNRTQAIMAAIRLRLIAPADERKVP
jgi:DNA-binding NarL/FixJ family response regulator